MSIWTILFVVLLIAWLGGLTVFHVAGGLIHLFCSEEHEREKKHPDRIELLD